MISKKLMILAIFIVSFLAISAVSAEDNATSDIVGVDETTNDVVNLENEVNVENQETNVISEANNDFTLNSNDTIQNPKTFTDLNAAINDNNDSDIYLDGNYTYSSDDSDFIGGIIVDRAVTIHGNGYTIDGNKNARIFTITNSNVVLYDIIFVNAKTTTEGGAVNGDGTAINCTFKDNAARRGGAVCGAATLINCSFIGNSVTYYGGATYGNCTAINCIFEDNSAIPTGYGRQGFGGAMMGANSEYYADLNGCSATNCTFINNRASNYGAALFGGSVKNCTFIGNRGYSGALVGNAYNCLFIDNSADERYGRGGAVYSVVFPGDIIYVVNCTFTGNSAYSGGAVYDCIVTDSTFIDNTAGTGGAMYQGSAENCMFINNSATADGGAISSASAVNCTFIGNHAAQYGGAVEANGYKAINCVFINNTAKNGGATHLIDVNYCNFTNNNATEKGGAMYGGISVNSSFTENHAGIDGGAIFDVVTSNSLFEYNSAVNGGAMAKGKVTDSTFNYNIASAYGGAIYDAEVATNNQFNYNVAPNGTDTFNVVWFDKRNAKTFADLNDLINGNNDREVYLNDDYLFDPYYDFDFMGGIVIGRAVTVHGNSHEIDGWNVTRMFTVTNDSVVFIGIDFVNGRVSALGENGGAINGKSIAVNCNFINNSATDELGNGGAMYYGTAKNCTFINNYAGDCGGAIYWGDAEDSTFINNYAGDDGGAIWRGSALNCIFKDNRAVDYAGAVDGSAENCNFTNNSAKTGGAVYGSAMNCIFIDNHASSVGGAVYYASYVKNCIFINNSATSGGACYDVNLVNQSSFINNSASDLAGACYNVDSIENSNFTGNTAKYGGAADQCSAINCIFTDNCATNSGGAMWGNSVSATNCIFTNNYAPSGGACFQIDVIESYFKDNNASEYGGAMYFGDAYDCVFIDNFAGIDGNDTYDTVIHKPTLSASNYTSTYDSGAKLAVNFLTSTGKPITNAKITIRVYKNDGLVGTYYCSSGAGWVVSLGVGVYNAVLSVENQGYDVEPANATLTVSKASTALSASAVTTVYNVNKNLVVTLKSNNKALASKKVTVKVGTISKTLTTNSKGQVSVDISTLAAKAYTASVKFAGDANYMASSKSVKVTVKKATPKVVASAKAFKVKDKTKKYVVTMKTNKNKALKNVLIYIKVNGKTYSAKTNSKGQATFKLTKLTKVGKFNAAITFKGNNCYNKLSKTVKITVKK